MILQRDIGENEEIPVETYLSDVLIVGIAKGRAPTSTEYEELGRFSETSGRRKFGTWDNTLGAVCSYTFNLRAPLDYMILSAEEQKEERKSITKELVEEENNLRIHPTEWKHIKEEIGMEERNHEEISREEALSDYRKYKENWANKENNRFFISTMSKILKTPPQEYIRYYTNMDTADKMIGEKDIYPTNIGRGSRRKLNNFLEVADMLTVKMKREDLPGSKKEVDKIAKMIEKSLPEKFK